MDNYLEELEDSNLSSDTREAAADSLALTQALHDLFTDIGMIRNKEVDVDVLEKSVDSLVAELMAAAIFCASFKNLSQGLRQAANKLEKDKDAPELIAVGYRKFADRVDKTQKTLLE